MPEIRRSQVQPPELLVPKSYPFSWGICAQGSELLFLSGQVSTDIDRNIIGVGDMTAQTRQVYKNIGLMLAEVGASFTNTVEFTTYLVGRQHLEDHTAAVLELFPSLFPDGLYPSNTVLLVEGLYLKEFLIEVKTTAVLS